MGMEQSSCNNGDGVLEHWSSWALGHWSTEALEHWRSGVSRRPVHCSSIQRPDNNILPSIAPYTSSQIFVRSPFSMLQYIKICSLSINFWGTKIKMSLDIRLYLNLSRRLKMEGRKTSDTPGSGSFIDCNTQHDPITRRSWNFHAIGSWISCFKKQPGFNCPDKCQRCLLQVKLWITPDWSAPSPDVLEVCRR